MRDRKVLFFGPFPPPVHGFSYITKCFYDELCRSRVNVVFVDLSPKGWWGIFLSLIYTFRFLFVNFRCDVSVYLALSGGRRQMFDFLLLLISRGFVKDITLHHHSFSYINNYSHIASLIFKLVANARHIVLGRKMAQGLQLTYSLKRASFHPISNAAFLGAPSGLMDFHRRDRIITISFLSNITRMKGIFSFFSLIRLLRSRNLHFNVSIAGPVDPLIEMDFLSELNSLPNCQYLGALYGERKTNFFKGIDLLVFPTHYVNEAEPVVIWEAMQFGVPVVAFDRGCISEQVDENSGHVTIPSGQNDFHADAINWISKYILDHEFYELMRRGARERFDFSRSCAKSDLLSFIDRFYSSRL